MFRNDEIEYATNDDGRKVAILEIGTQLLPVICIDTYQLFDGNSYFENEHDYLHGELGLPDGVVEVNVTNREGLLKGLAEHSHEWVSEALYDHDNGAVQAVGDVTGTWSPQFYNFATDQYDAKYSIDLELMEEWIAKHDWDYDAYGRKEFASYDGFASRVPGSLDDPSMQEGMRLWLFVYAYMEEMLGRDERHPWHYEHADDWKMHMWEQEHEIYMENCTPEWCRVGISWLVNDLVDESRRVHYTNIETPDWQPWESASDVPELTHDDTGARFDEWLGGYVERLQSTVAV